MHDIRLCYSDDDVSIPERVMVAESQRGKILKGDESFDMDEIRWFFPQR